MIRKVVQNMSEDEWLKHWEEQHLASCSDDNKEIANMNQTDFVTMLAELEGK